MFFTKTYLTCTTHCCSFCICFAFIFFLKFQKTSLKNMAKEIAIAATVMAKIKRTWPAPRTIVSVSVMAGIKSPSNSSRRWLRTPVRCVLYRTLQCKMLVIIEPHTYYEASNSDFLACQTNTISEIPALLTIHMHLKN